MLASNVTALEGFTVVESRASPRMAVCVAAACFSSSRLCMRRVLLYQTAEVWYAVATTAIITAVVATTVIIPATVISTHFESQSIEGVRSTIHSGAGTGVRDVILPEI